MFAQQEKWRENPLTRRLIMRKLDRWILFGAVAVFLVFGYFVVLGGPFGYFSICDRCGARRDTVVWEFPFSHFRIYSRSQERSTPLSQVLVTNGLVKSHPHNWLFGHGSGNGVKCAIGSGRHISAAAESVEFAALVQTLHQNGETAFRDRILRGALDPEKTREYWRLGDHAPTNATRSELRAWIVNETEMLDLWAALRDSK
jgi:hypothetical protein